MTRAGDRHTLAEQRTRFEPRQLGCRYRTDHDHARRLEFEIAEGRQGRPNRALLRPGPPLDGSGRGFGSEATREQSGHDLGQASDAHEDDDRSTDAGNRFPIQFAALVRILVSGHDGERGRRMPQGDGNPGIGRHGDRRGDPRDHLVRETRRFEGGRFLAAAGEDERIAALETDDVQPGSSPFDEKFVDVVLRHHRPARALGDTDPLGSLRRQFEEGTHRQPVVDDHIGGGEHLGTPKGQQSRVAGPGANQIDGHGAEPRGSLPGLQIPG
ncbi:unannotated protein [freshwater metagenome]|uniref:Unannotated protein n=1 Tax=freshwater metagenome TaxID=449393 RepID=A0A6J6GZL8_9ZZZZ